MITEWYKRWTFRRNGKKTQPKFTHVRESDGRKFSVAGKKDVRG